MNRNIKRKKTVKPRFYIVLMLITVISVAASFYFNLATQTNKLTVAKANIEYLTENKATDLTTWHNNELKYVYLTFDDGPSKNTNKVLDILDQYGVDATFFVLGTNVSNLNYSDEALNRMLTDGHYIGMHSMTHQYDKLYKGPNAPANFVGEMSELQDLIASKTNGFVSELIRAPYGTGGGTFKPEHVEAVKNAHLKCWDWDVDSMDWSYTPTQVMTNIKKYTEQNSNKNDLVVLFHEKNVTLEVLPQVIEYYRDLGYEFAAYNPENPVIVNFMNSLDI